MDALVHCASTYSSLCEFVTVSKEEQTITKMKNNTQTTSEPESNANCKFGHLVVAHTQILKTSIIKTILPLKHELRIHQNSRCRGDSCGNFGQSAKLGLVHLLIKGR